MATFVERRRSRLRDLLTIDVTQDELEEVKALLRQLATRNNDHCKLLSLPPEIRNQIYRYVAEDAHARYVHYLPMSLDPVYATNLMKDTSGAKARPGLFLACRQIHDEFHRIFYSNLFVTAQIYIDHGKWQDITSSALLDTIVNEKHNIFLAHVTCSENEFVKRPGRQQTPGPFARVQGLVRLSDSLCVEFVMSSIPPLCDWAFARRCELDISDCRTYNAHDVHYVLRKWLCSVCLLSGQGKSTEEGEKETSRVLSSLAARGIK